MSTKNSVGLNKVKLNKMCRTCLSKDNNLYSVFDVCLEDTTLNEIIAVIAGIEVSIYNINYYCLVSLCVPFFQFSYKNLHRNLITNIFFRLSMVMVYHLKFVVNVKKKQQLHFILRKKVKNLIYTYETCVQQRNSQQWRFLKLRYELILRLDSQHNSHSLFICVLLLTYLDTNLP